MTGNTDPVEKQASKEATDWFILLKDEPDDAVLRREFEAWRQRSSVNATAWDAIQQASKAMDTARPVYSDRWAPALAKLRAQTQGEGANDRRPTIVGTRRSADARRPSRGARRGRRRAMQVGGLAAAACFLALLVGPDLLRDLGADHATGTAEVRTVKLPDDTAVTLAPESAIAVSYTSAERYVRLLEGEAFFEVTPNAERPFRVAARGVDVAVVGTAFGVRRGDDGTRVAVVEGVVRVSHDGAAPAVAETLVAGQLVQVSWAGQAERSDLPVDRVATWRHNQLIARDQPLGAVVDELRRFYAGRIIVTDAALAARPVTGVYNLADPVAALRGIARAQNAVVRRITPWLVLVSAS